MKTKLMTVAVATAMAAGAAGAATLDDVKAAGSLKCGVSQGLPGFSATNDAGEWTGIDVDYCKALAAAVLGDANAVEYVSLSAKDRFTALSSGEIDVLSRNTTWTITRDTDLGITFVGVNYYDGQGMMVPAGLGIKSALELDGATICTNTGTTTELNITDYFQQHDMTFELVALENSDEVIAAYGAGRCDVFTTDRSGVAAERLKLADPEAHVVLPETISKEPLGPSVRAGDEQWMKIAKWVLFGVIEAEEYGITSENVEEMMSSENPSVQRILGVGDNNYGASLGLEADFIKKAVEQVGNYGEMYERNVGPDTPLKLDRGVNNLWNNGGFMYAPPIR
ncbi:MAG: amino acid ABC transporter substrate-binding protein [Sagittula sp.]|jgi:general L-amino acid transport system substrate-binding protein|uniref:amino acid ABC transporter substrate-binding protein n=1 Tax=unclassified Sagittula TaxID=2624628 RepID=UPI000C2D3290|nr:MULTISPECIES: amino acid ABC transporter substrate-binding protein [unclassified Sagittula]AUC52138.1 amino acid ABC transporter substrate-binding protein [Sagittula sp. P11]WHZ36655.1 amino acid ABC transporter substrate-binding protein [Sagittula sp. MA-2]